MAKKSLQLNKTTNSRFTSSKYFKTIVMQTSYSHFLGKALAVLLGIVLLSGNYVIAQDDNDAELVQFILDFNADLDKIVNDYPGNFKNILGDAREREEGSMQQYDSKVQLPESMECYFTKTLSEPERLTFVSVFSESNDEADAREIFAGLSYIISISTFSCCEMDLLANDGDDFYMANTYLHPINPSSGYETLEIKVSLYKGFDIDEDFNFTDTYNVVLNVRPIDDY